MEEDYKTNGQREERVLENNKIGFFRTIGFVARAVYIAFRGPSREERQREFSDNCYHNHFCRRGR